MSGEGPLPGLHPLAVILTLLLIRAEIPFKRAPSSWPNYLPEIPPPNTIPLGNKNSTNIPSVARLDWVATRLHEVSLLVHHKCGEKILKILDIFAWGWHKWRHLHAMSFKALNPSQATLTHTESLIFHLYWCHTVKIRRSDSDVENSQIPQNSKSASGSNERASLLLPRTWTAACISSSFSWIGSILCCKGPYECPCGHSSHPALYSPHDYPIFGHGFLGVGIGTSALPSALQEHGPRKCLGKEFWDPSAQRWSLYKQVFLARRPCPIRRSSTKHSEALWSAGPTARTPLARSMGDFVIQTVNYLTMYKQSDWFHPHPYPKWSKWISVHIQSLSSQYLRHSLGKVR